MPYIIKTLSMVLHTKKPLKGYPFVKAAKEFLKLGRVADEVIKEAVDKT